MNNTTRALLRSFAAFWAFTVFYRFAAVLHYSLTPPLGESVLPLWIVGAISGGAGLGQMLLDVPAGHLVDRYGKKRMLAIGWVAFVFSALLLTRFSLVTYIASVALSVFGWLFLAPATNAYILAYAKKETSGRLLALRDSFGSFGMMLSSMALPLVLLYAPAVMGLIILAVLAFAIVALWMSPPDKPSPHTEPVLPAEPYHIRRTYLSSIVTSLKKLNRASAMLCIYYFAGAIFYGTIWFVVPLVMAAGVQQQFLGFGLAVFDLSVVALGVFIGTLVDKGDKRRIAFYGLLLFAIMALVIGTSFGPLFLLFGFLAAVGDEMTNLSLWSWLHSLDTEHAHDGAVSGAISFSEDFGYAVAPIIAALLFSFLGATWAIVLSALPLLVTWIFYTLLVHPHLSFHLSTATIPQMPMRRRHKS